MRSFLKQQLNARQRNDLARDRMKQRGIVRMNLFISTESAHALAHLAQSTGENQSQWVQKLILAAYRQAASQGLESSSPSGS